MRVERVRDFGGQYLALALWRRLGLHTLLGELIEAGAEQVPWELTAALIFCERYSKVHLGANEF